VIELQLVYPMFALVLITAAVLVILFRSRAQAVRDGKMTARYFRIYQGEVEPEQAAKSARHFSNLFEAPTLFYAACLTAMVTRDGGQGVVLLAWLYVAARLAHAVIHLGANRLRPRISAYFVGWLALLAIWIHVVVHAFLTVS
jgi:hypothetical protein